MRKIGVVLAMLAILVPTCHGYINWSNENCPTSRTCCGKNYKECWCC